jgi:hypothetical protein
MAWRTAKAEPARVIVPALVIFAFEALAGTVYIKLSVDHLGLESLGAFLVYGASTLGLTFYSGMLERLVGSVERNEAPQPIADVLRTLPWFRLLAAEAILLLIDAAAALVAVIPALVVATLLALVGPLINLIDARVPQAFRRSIQLVWPHFFLVFGMITLPLEFEHSLTVAVTELIPHEQAWLIFLITFIISDLFGMALGLMEVTIAERLVTGAHGPGQDVRSEDIELPGWTATT